jgi:antitoxin VapB
MSRRALRGGSALGSWWQAWIDRSAEWHIWQAYAIREASFVGESGAREVRLFRNNRNQAIRIPVEFELPGDRAILRKEGDRLIIEPVRKAGLLGLLAQWQASEGPLDEAFPEIEDAPAQAEDVFG